MKLVAIVRAPRQPEEAAKALADASGLTLAEARMRLAPEPPALLARLEPDKAAALVVSLRKGGWAALAVDVPCPTGKDRTVAHSLSFSDAGHHFHAALRRLDGGPVGRRAGHHARPSGVAFRCRAHREIQELLGRHRGRDRRPENDPHLHEDGALAG